MNLFASWILTLMLHASLALGLVWALERLRLLRHAGVAELAWRAALFGALLSASWASLLRPMIETSASESSRPVAVAPVAPVADSPAANRVAIEAAVTPAAAPASTAASSPPAASTGLELPELAVLALAFAWSAALLVAMLKFGRQWLGLRHLQRLARRAGRAPSPALHGRISSTAAALGLDPAPQARLLATLASPLALPGARVLLPEWVETLPQPQQTALLAHELAHLRRRDPFWRLAQRAALIPLGLHPLAWVALRRLEELSEQACDRHAAAQTGSGRPLAECLALCLEHARRQPSNPLLAVAMAGASGPVLRRVQSLLKESPMSPQSLSPLARRSLIGLAVVVTLALPGLVVTSVAGAGIGQFIQRLDSHQFNYRETSAGRDLEVKLNGKLDVNADETDVVALDNGGELQISEEVGGRSREILFRGKAGTLERRYRRDGDEQPLDADGRRWLAQMIPELYRQTGLNVEARSQRILAAGGVPALFAEIGKIRSDHSRARYLGQLFAHTALTTEELAQALKLAAAIGSDFELRQALQPALEKQAFDPARTVQLLQLAKAIDSDFERRQLLVSLVEARPLEGEVLTAFLDAFTGMSSDFEQRQVVEALMLAKPTPAAVDAMLGRIDGIGSDFELRNALLASLPLLQDTAGHQRYVQVSSKLGSDFERREALLPLLARGKVDMATADAVLASADGMGSDFEASQVLVALAGAMPADGGLIARYRTVARGFGDHERLQAEKALDRFSAEL